MSFIIVTAKKLGFMKQSGSWRTGELENWRTGELENWRTGELEN
jgi:hypothetical protein